MWRNVTQFIAVAASALTWTACVQTAPETKSSLRTGVTGSAVATSTAAGTSTDTTRTLTYLADTQAIFNAACVSCHGVPPQNGAPTNFRLDSYHDAGGISGIQAMLTQITAQLTAKTMPPGGGLSDQDRQTLLSWIAAGAPYDVPTTTATSSVTATATATATDTTTGPTQLVPVADASLTYYDDAKALLDANCVSCHGATPTSGAPLNFRLDTYDDVGSVAGVHTMAPQISLQVATRTMPEGATMADSDRQTILNWIAGGAAEGTPPPSLAFTAPAAGTPPTVTSGSYTVTLAFANAGGATYDLYDTTTSGQVTGGSAIASGVPVTTTSQTFNTSALSNGTYYFYVVLHDGTTTLSAPSAGGITVQNDGFPTVTLATDVQNATGIHAVTLPDNGLFTASDPDNATLTYDIEYSPDDGTTWNPLVTGQTYDAATPYNWSALPSEGEGVHYKLRVTVHNALHSAQASSTNSFGLTDKTYTFANTNPIQPLLQSSCGSCHTTGGPGLGPSAWTYQDETSAKNQAPTMLTDIQSGNMPQSGSLTQAQKDALTTPIKLWIGQGYQP